MADWTPTPAQPEAAHQASASAPGEHAATPPSADLPPDPDHPTDPRGYPTGPALPGYGAPGYGTPGYGTPGYGTPGYGTPGYGGPGYGGPGHGAPGQGGPGYGTPGYGGPGYGSPGYGSPGYGGAGNPGQAGYGGASGGYPPPGPGYAYRMPGDYLPGDVIGLSPQRPRPSIGSRILTYIVVAALAAGVGAGAVLALSHSDSSNPSSFSLPGAGSIPQSDGGASNASGANEQAVNNEVSPGIVDVISTPSYQEGTLEGTGMILNKNGLVLTNNHVIEGTSRVTAKIADTGRMYNATVIGTDATDDVALIKLDGATNLKTIPLGNSNTAQVGDPVVALGNAEGEDGAPTVVTGRITNINQSITASDAGAGTTENLHGMLQTDAPIVAGDSGGALANAKGQVIGMNTAANESAGLGGQNASMGFAIPINRALSIARLIAAGRASSTIVIGLPAFLGVTVASSSSGPSTSASPAAQLQQLQQAASQQNGFGGFGFGNNSGNGGGCESTSSASAPSTIPRVSSGTLIGAVLCGTPVDAAGIPAGSVITSIDGQTVSAPTTLTRILTRYHPGDTVSLDWVAPNGQRHTTSITLAAGPAK
jgi:S1-C subfamily serine protease